jgi:hypothetical protein
MTRRRRDTNHALLAKLWRSLGGSWQDTADIPGALDGVAGIFGVDQRVEIKSMGTPSTQQLTPAEAKVFREWQGRPPVIWITEDDVIATRAAMLQTSAKAKGGY